MTTFSIEASLVIAPKGALKAAGDVAHGTGAPIVQCQLNYVQTWGPPSPTFDLEQAQVHVVGKLRT